MLAFWMDVLAIWMDVLAFWLARKVVVLGPHVALANQNTPKRPRSDFALSKSYGGKEASPAYELQLPPFALATKQLLMDGNLELRKKKAIFSEEGWTILETEGLF